MPRARSSAPGRRAAFSPCQAMPRRHGPGWQAAESQPTRPGHPQSWCHRPLDQARALEAAPVAWPDEHADGAGLVACAEQHTGYARFRHAAWDHPLHAAVINAAGCQVPGIARAERDHSIRHRGERPGGQVYPVTLDQDGKGEMLLHWTIRTCKAAPCPQPELGAERDDLCGRKHVPLIIPPCK